MATNYTSNRPSEDGLRSRVEPGISRNGSAQQRANPGARRTSGSAQGGRPVAGTASRGAGYGSRPQASRTGQTPNRGRQPSNRRRGGGLPPAAAIALIVVALVLVFFIIKWIAGGSRNQDPAQPVTANVTQTAQPGDADDGAKAPTQYSDIQALLADSDNASGSLDASEMAQVTDLSINESLPSEWLNVLLLGTDERILSDSARTDSMIICSINRNTGEVKLASLMRDLAIEFDDIGKYNGTWRINAANFFGGANLAMKTVNECFNMNIQYYAMVNFFGFQKIVQRLGGIEIDITQEEMEQINKWAYNSYKIAQRGNIDISDVVYEELKTYGENVHLNGTQALAYARIRKLQGGDYMRSQRQRTVLEKLLKKVKGLSALEIASLGAEMLDQVKTNMELNDVVTIAVAVCSNGIADVKSMHLPVSGTYKEETRNNQSMLYDCDFSANAIQLYNFIYE